MDDPTRLLDEFLAAHADMPGVLMHIDAPTAGKSWAGGAGVVNRGGELLRGDECFRTASVTKTFVATAILRLVEEGRLELDAPVAGVLPAHVAGDLSRVFPEAAASATLRHLLQHTSGIYDFGTDATYRRTIAQQQQKVWSAEDLIAVALANGRAYCLPGERFHYSDTGYVLLALCLERCTGMPFASALRSVLRFDDLGLASTWLEGKEAAPVNAPRRVHQYVGDADTFGYDPSFDGYGGGGLVSTAADLARFLRALIEGRILGESVLSAMLDCSVATDLGTIGQTHGLGIFRSVVDGRERVGHEGFWGIWMYHFPDEDVTVAGAHTCIPFEPAAKERLLQASATVLLEAP